MAFLNHPQQCDCPVCKNYQPYQLGSQQDKDWQAEYEFYYKIISGEVERLRFNGGYEPIFVELYPTQLKAGPAFIGKTQVGHVHFRATANWGFDPNGQKILKLHILKAP